MIQLKNMESMKFREDNSHQLRKELKQESKAVYGLVKSILSMDHNADLYNGTASTFYPLGEEMYEQLLEDLRAAKKFIFIEFYIIDEGLMWNSILEILEQKVKEGSKSNSFMTTSAVWQPWLGTIPNDCERWGLMPISLTR